jgi:hypothetical protein
MGRGYEILRLAPLLVVFGAALAGCDTDDPIDDSGRPLAWVSGQKLTSADLRFTGTLEEPDQRREVIDRGVDDLLVAREARRRGLGYTEQAVKQIAAVRRAAEIRERRILRDVLYEVMASEVEISEAELREESDRFEGFHRRRLVTLRSQTFRSRASAEEALHTPVTASKIVGPMLVRELPAVLRKATKRLNAIGERVVVPTGEMWSSVELIAEEILAPPTFERARDALQQRLHRRKAAEAFERELERLRAAADIQLEPGVLDNDTLWLPGASSEDSAPPAQPY